MAAPSLPFPAEVLQRCERENIPHGIDESGPHDRILLSIPEASNPSAEDFGRLFSSLVRWWTDWKFIVPTGWGFFFLCVLILFDATERIEHISPFQFLRLLLYSDGCLQPLSGGFRLWCLFFLTHPGGLDGNPKCYIRHAVLKHRKKEDYDLFDC